MKRKYISPDNKTENFKVSESHYTVPETYLLWKAKQTGYRDPKVTVTREDIDQYESERNTANTPTSNFVSRNK